MKIKKWLIPAAFCLLLGGLQTSTVAFARGRGGGMRAAHSRLGEAHERFRGGYRGGDFGRVIRPRVFIEPSLGWYWGYGWNYPWIWDPYYYPGPESVEVRHVDYGTLEFKVKPEDTKIYVDSKFIGTGSPGRRNAGPHHLCCRRKEDQTRREPVTLRPIYPITSASKQPEPPRGGTREKPRYQSLLFIKGKMSGRCAMDLCRIPQRHGYFRNTFPAPISGQSRINTEDGRSGVRINI